MSSHKKDLRGSFTDLGDDCHDVVIATDGGVLEGVHIFVDGKELIASRDEGITVETVADSLQRVTLTLLVEQLEVITLSQMEERLIKE